MSPSYESPSPPPRGRALDVAVPAGVALVLVVISFAFRAPCVAHLGNLEYSERHLCYTDIYALYGVEGLDKGRVPYFDQRPDGEYVEFPVLTGAWMLATSRISGAIVGEAQRSTARGYSTYFWINQFGFGLLIIVTAAALGALAGRRRALLFAAAPTLVLHGGVSWDILAVAPFVLALLAFSRARDGTAGILLGIGAAAKLYPIFAVPFLALQRIRERRYAHAGLLTGAALASAVALNLPFAIGAREGWLQFFRLNRERPADWDSIWYHLTQTWHVTFQTSRLNLVTAALFVIGAVTLAAWLWWRLGRADEETVRGLQRSTASALLLVTLWFLIVNKVWSPQYGIWLLPFWSFAVPLRSWPLIVTWGAFQGMEIFVFVTRFWMFARKVTYPWFRDAVFVRLGASLILIAFVLTRRARPPAEAEAAPASA